MEGAGTSELQLRNADVILDITCKETIHVQVFIVFSQLRPLLTKGLQRSYDTHCQPEVSVQGTVDLRSYIMPFDRYSHTVAVHRG